MQTVVCGYCNQQATLVYGDRIYPHLPNLHGKRYYLCLSCGAYVGCHGDTGIPLGTPANLRLRIARGRAHNAFDALWKGNATLSRKAAYKLLGEWLGITPDKCHIGMFDLDQCATTIAFVNNYKNPQIDT